MSGLAAIVAALKETGQFVAAPEAPLPAITGVTDDSRLVGPGHLFCAIEGTVQDGHAFLEDARARGAAAAVVSRRSTTALPLVLVRDSRSAAAVAAREWYGRPADGMEIVGVTGTNGKTTTVTLLRHLLDRQGTAGSVGTLGAIDGAGRSLEGYGPLTTPGTVELQAVLADLRRRGVRTVAMEASSHALDQRRLETVVLAAAVYTNLPQDHLDYHADLDAYRDAKLRLSSYLADDGVEVVNADEPAWRALPTMPGRRVVRYGRRVDAQVRTVSTELDADGATVSLAFGERRVTTRLPLLGDFNVSNALAAAAAAWALGEEPDAVAQRLGQAPQVPGRMERLASGDFVILRDYAHTPDALERAIAAVRPLSAGRLLVLFGAGGDRDRGKRPLMGRVAAQGADLVIVTSDNPRTEDPERIIDEIEAGMEGREHLRVADRHEAIRRAVGLLAPGDCLLLAGKGHETYQVIGTERRPFDEHAIVRAALAEGTPA